MRKIKFRGYDTRDGVREMVTFTLDELLAGTDDYELVDPDSVVQFIGYDADGKEVYEGDKLKHVDDENYNAIAHFETFIGVKTGTIQNLYDCHSEKIFHAQNSKFWKLKE